MHASMQQGARCTSLEQIRWHVNRLQSEVSITLILRVSLALTLGVATVQFNASARQVFNFQCIQATLHRAASESGCSPQSPRSP